MAILFFLNTSTQWSKDICNLIKKKKKKEKKLYILSLQAFDPDSPVVGTRRNHLLWTVSRKLRGNRQMSLNVRPCLYWGLSHLWSVTNAAGLLQAPGSLQMTLLEWKSGARSAAGRGDFCPGRVRGGISLPARLGWIRTGADLMFSVLVFPTRQVGAELLGRRENFREKGFWRDWSKP